MKEYSIRLAVSSSLKLLHRAGHRCRGPGLVGDSLRFAVRDPDLEPVFASGHSLPDVDGAKHHRVSELLTQVLQAGRLTLSTRLWMVSLPLAETCLPGPRWLFGTAWPSASPWSSLAWVDGGLPQDVMGAGGELKKARYMPGRSLLCLPYEEEPPHRRRMGNLPELRILSANPARRHVLPACNMFAP